MNSIPVFSLALSAGLAVLIWSAGRFVHGASTVAQLLGISPLVIGLTIVALGTSAPEIFTSAAAAWAGAPDIAIGNVIGSNIANIGLILGCTLLATPLAIPASLKRRELPVLVLVTLGTALLFRDGWLDQGDAYLLLLLLAAFMWYTYHGIAPGADDGRREGGNVAELPDGQTPGGAAALMLVSLILMVAGSNALVWGAHNLALSLGVSELVVGLAIVAVGTSLPELATSLSGALKGHHELVLGNVAGSNILNILLVLPLPGFTGPVALARSIPGRDYPAMLAFVLMLALLVYLPGPSRKHLGRGSGAVFIVLYLAYTATLIATHDFR